MQFGLLTRASEQDNLGGAFASFSSRARLVVLRSL